MTLLCPTKVLQVFPSTTPRTPPPTQPTNNPFLFPLTLPVCQSKHYLRVFKAHIRAYNFRRKFWLCHIVWKLFLRWQSELLWIDLMLILDICSSTMRTWNISRTHKFCYNFLSLIFVMMVMLCKAMCADLRLLSEDAYQGKSKITYVLIESIYNLYRWNPLRIIYSYFSITTLRHVTTFVAIVQS